MTTLAAPIALARLSPAISASYSTSLLVVGKLRRTIHSTVSPSSDSNTALAPPPPPACLLGDPSVCMLHKEDSSAPLSLSLVNYAMKSTMICPLMAVSGQYWMSNSLNSMAHSANRLAVSGLLIARRKGLSVRTITMWA